MSDHPTSDDLERLEKLTLGLVMNPKESWQAQPRLFVGTIPEHLQVELPVPEQTEVLGTLARNASTLDMVLDSQLSAEEVQSFYRMRLTALGWLEPDEHLAYHPGGFTHHPGPPPQMPGVLPRVITFCHDSSGAGLTVIVHPLDDHTTRVRVELALESYRNRCRELAQRRLRGQGMMPRVIPLLAPPPGAQQESQAAFGGYHGVFSAALLTTTLGLEAVAVHYADQLRRAGWTQTDQNTRGILAWQTWQFTSEEQQPWTGLFLALRTPEQPSDYFLFLRGILNAPPSTAPAMTYGPTKW
jgi:hypothetical protein